MKKITGLFIDPQNDFCEGGALGVPGGNEALGNIAKMLSKHKTLFSGIHCSLDSHHNVHIAHPVWLVDSNGNHPLPITQVSNPLDAIITTDKIGSGFWKATNPAMQAWTEKYVYALENNGRYALCIWPEHCLINRPGANIHPELEQALTEWEMLFRKTNYVPKGSCIYAEHYSVIKADVEYPGDPSTTVNYDFVEMLKKSDVILVGGLASSHCLGFTLRDIIDEFDADQIKKIVLLTDATAPVPGFEKQAEDFINEFTAKGMQLSTTKDFF